MHKPESVISMFRVFDRWYFGHAAESHMLVFSCSTKQEAEAYIKEAVDTNSGKDKADFYIVEQQE